MVNPTRPPFLTREGTSREGEINAPNLDLSELAQAYARFDPEVKRSIPFTVYSGAEATMNHKKETIQTNKDLQHKVGNLTIPNFDGSGKITAHAWIQN